MIWLSSWLYIPSKPWWWRRISPAWRLCVRSQRGRAEGDGGGGEISWDHRGAPRQKGHCGTDWPIQENITSCPTSSSKWTAHFPELSLFLTSSAVNCFQQQSLLTICRHSNYLQKNWIQNCLEKYKQTKNMISHYPFIGRKKSKEVTDKTWAESLGNLLIYPCNENINLKMSLVSNACLRFSVKKITLGLPVSWWRE